MLLLTCKLFFHTLRDMDTLTDALEIKKLSFLDRLRWIIPKIPDSDDKVFGLIFFLFAALPLVFYPFLRDGFEPLKLALFLVMVGIISILFFRNKIITAKENSYFTWLLIGFGIFVSLSTIFSQDLGLSIIGLTGRGSNSFLFLFFWAAFTWLVLAKLSQDKLKFLFKTVFFTGLLISVYSLLQHAGYGYYSGLKVETRVLVPSFIGNPNFTAMYLIPLVPLGIWFYSQVSSVKSKVYFGISSIVIIWALVDSVSRAAVLGLILSLIIIIVGVVIKRVEKRLLFASIMALLMTLGLSFTYFETYRPENISESLAGTELNQQYRFAVWDMSTDIISDFPLTGTGPANFYLEFRKRAWSTFSAGDRFDDPHNIFLLLASTGGIPVAILFISLIFYACWISVKRYFRNGDIFALILLSATLGFTLSMSFNPVVIPCWLLLSLFLAAQILPVSKTKQIEIRLSFRAIVIVLCLLGIIAGTNYIVGEWLTNQSRLSFAAEDYQKTLKQSKVALFLNPINGDATRYLLESRIRLNEDPNITEEILLRSLADHLNSSSAHANSASVYYQLWKQTNNVEYLHKMDDMTAAAIQLEPTYSALYSQMAYLEFKAGNAEQALHYGRLALTYNPDQFYGWVLLAKLYYDLGQKPQFLYSYEKAFYYSQDNLVIKKSLQDYKALENIREIPFPVIFPEPTNQ